MCLEFIIVKIINEQSVSMNREGKIRFARPDCLDCSGVADTTGHTSVVYGTLVLDIGAIHPDTFAETVLLGGGRHLERVAHFSEATLMAKKVALDGP